MRVKAAVLHKTGQPLEVVELDLAEPREGEVLVRIRAAGVCHSDYHVISGQAAHDLPVVLGHEGAGEVMAVAGGVTSVKPGDHVVLNWNPDCGACFFCTRDETHLCQAHNEPLWQGTMLDGTCRLSNDQGQVRHLSMLACWADHVVVPQESCVRIDKAVPFEVAALLGCAVTTGVGAVLNRAKVAEAASVAVIGAGGVGLSIIMGAELARAERIIAIDSSAGKEPIAREMGATDFISAGDDIAAKLSQIMPQGFDHVFEAVGKRDLQQAAIDYCRPGGQVTFVGLDSDDATIDLPSTHITRTEKTITGSIFGSACTRRDFNRYGQYFMAGDLPIDRLIGRRYRLEQINQAIADMLAGKPGRGVVVFEPPEQ